MPKDKPFYELCKKAKRRRLNAEDVEELSSISSSVDFDQSHVQQSYSPGRKNNSKIPDFLYLEKEFSHHSGLSYHSKLSHHFELSSF